MVSFKIICEHFHKFIAGGPFSKKATRLASHAPACSSFNSEPNDTLRSFANCSYLHKFTKLFGNFFKGKNILEYRSLFDMLKKMLRKGEIFKAAPIGIRLNQCSRCGEKLKTRPVDKRVPFL
jgi:hypothetical protein